MLALVRLGALLARRDGRRQDLVRGTVKLLDENSVHMAVDTRRPLGQLGDATRGPSYRIVGWAAESGTEEGPGVHQIAVATWADSGSQP